MYATGVMTRRNLLHNFFSIYLSVFCCFADVKVDMESRIGEWQRQLEELSGIFKKMCKSHKKSLEREDALVTYVANKQLGLLKRVNVYFAK